MRWNKSRRENKLWKPEPWKQSNVNNNNNSNKDRNIYLWFYSVFHSCAKRRLMFVVLCAYNGNACVYHNHINQTMRISLKNHKKAFYNMWLGYHCKASINFSSCEKRILIKITLPKTFPRDKKSGSFFFSSSFFLSLQSESFSFNWWMNWRLRENKACASSHSQPIRGYGKTWQHTVSATSFYFTFLSVNFHIWCFEDLTSLL